MLNKKIGCIALIVLLAAAGMLLFRPPDLPDEAAQSLTTFLSVQVGSSTDYKIVSAEKATRTLGAHPEYVAFSQGSQLPSGIFPPDNPSVQANWCVTLDQPTRSLDGPASHFLLQQRDGIWIVAGVPDSQRPVFRSMGCSRW